MPSTTLQTCADQVLGDAPVLGEHQQALRVDVEASGGSQAAQVGGLE
ncbi:MAG: hypothetical protein KGZ83_17335 [Sulfuricella sp.]|nr:hypothetical protein [Sulfuricella sp.]